MPAFHAINVEPEDNVDEVVDTTRGLHIEDALKRFQTALKLHAQGPRFFDEAADAYEDLFKADIFSYPEAETDFDRAERQGLQTLPGLLFQPTLEEPVTDLDFAGGSAPQTALYFARKNRAQFVLDRIKHRARTAEVPREEFFEQDEILEEGKKALADFSTALDMDPSDPEVWRRSARVAAFLGSARTSRYCLEAAIELDDDPAVDEVEPPSLAEGLAGEELKDQLDVLSDDIGLSHPIMQPWIKKEMPAWIKRTLDPLPFLPDPTRSLAIRTRSTPSDLSHPRRVIQVPTLSWADLAIAMLRLVSEEGFSGKAIVVELPATAAVEDVAMPEDAILVDHVQDEKRQIEQQIASEAAQTEAQEKDQADNNQKADQKTEGSQAPPEAPVPSRKRSQSAAGLPEGGPEEENGVEKRSKRIRRRETAQEELMDPSTLHATLLQQYQAADQYLFKMTKEILENLGVTDQETLSRLTELLDSCASENRAAKVANTATKDLLYAITSFKDEHAKTLTSKKEQSAPGLSSFLEHAKTGSQNIPLPEAFDESTGLLGFTQRVNAGWMTIHELAFEWLKAVHGSYLSHKWSDSMKAAVVQVISRLDSEIYRRMRYELAEELKLGEWGQNMTVIEDMTEMLFELHLDVYERITNPKSKVDDVTRAETRVRLARWLDFASEMGRLRPRKAGDQLDRRFLWAAVFSVAFSREISPDHVLQCWTELRDLLSREQPQPFYLPNNVPIPEISAAAADREISWLTTRDFFRGLFQEDVGDPVAIIESLEPVLNPGSVAVPVESSGTNGTANGSARQTPKKMPITGCASQGLQDLWKFLAGSSTDLRLFLWSRLGEAYSKIKYKTKEFSCQLRSVEMIVADLESPAYTEYSQDARVSMFLKMLKSLDELLIPALGMALNEPSAFDIVDDEHIRSTSAALAKLSCLLHVSIMYEDEVRIGMTQAPSNSAAFQSLLNKLREIQVRAWSLQYTLIRAGISSDDTIFSTPETDLASYLAAIHQVLGLRKFCKASNRIFLKMMRVEILRMKNLDNWEDYLGQVLFDLHGLKLGVGLDEVHDHGCPPEKLERKLALSLVERITHLAGGIPMKDLLKSDLKTTIDHMQQAIGQTKSTAQMMYNFKNFTEYLKKPIHPLKLYQALNGGVTLDAVNVSTQEGNLAKHGWFFLFGVIALTRFRVVDLNRRQTPGATDDLRTGATFIRLQLQFTPDKWDAWFRLAECFDFELDEAVLWTADKMNKERSELVKLQRSAIHCYTLALSNSVNVETDLEDGDPIYELYHNFAMRLYASSREPFAMEPFQHSDTRFCIQNMGVGTYKTALHGQMSEYNVWKFAAALFKKAQERKPKNWKNPYMISKCLWKMYQKPLESLNAKDKESRPKLEDLVKSLEKAVEVVMAMPKSRNSEPILEPHYKIASVVHKLVMRGDLKPGEGVKILSRQPFGVSQDEDDPVEDLDGWEGYIIRNLRALKDKDKSNWQHRIIMRHARILFDDEEGSNNPMMVIAAFGILRDNMFTKTMVMNVWKCDAERAGRHYVYMEQYARFMVRLLMAMKDKANLDALLRRLRKKGADFYHFSDLWQSSCMSYLRLLRTTYGVKPMVDDIFKGTSVEEFELLSDRITEWAGSHTADHPAFSCLKDACELKRLNGNYMKPTAIDDLISDCYSLVYTEVARTLPGRDVGDIIKERAEERTRERERENQQQQQQQQQQQVEGAPAAKPFNPLTNYLNPPGPHTPNATGESGDKAGPAEAAPRGRKVVVKRADVLKKAEQAFARTTEAPKSAGVKSRLGSMSSGKNGSNTPNGYGEQGSENGDEDAEMKDAGAAEAQEEQEQDHGEESEPAANGQEADDADDESDLSDVPEGYDIEPPPGLLFPNLSRSMTTVNNADTPGADDEGSEGDDEEEEEEEEEEEGEGGEEGDEAEAGAEADNEGDGDVNDNAEANGEEMAPKMEAET